MLIALLLIIVLIFAFIKLKGSKGKGTAEDEKAADKAAAAQNRGVIFIDPGHGGMDSGSGGAECDVSEEAGKFYI